MATRFLVTGRVQGVGFRAFARRTAERLQLRGFARNLPDGSVESVVEGSVEAVEAYQAALSQGPALARVTEVTRDEVSVEPSHHNSFIIS